MVAGLLLSIGMLMILPWRCRSNLIFGLMVAGRTSLLSVGLEVAGAGVYIPASEVAFEDSVWGTTEEFLVMHVWNDAVLSCLFLGSCRLFSVLNSGVLLLPCRRTGLVIKVLMTLMLLGVLVVCWIMVAWLNLCLWLRMVI